MLAQPAQRQHRHHPGGQRPVAARQHVAAVDRNLDQHLVLLEIGPLDVEPHPVGKADRADPQQGLAGVADDLTGRAEIGVAETARRLAFGRADRCRHRLVPGLAQALVAIGRWGAALEPQQRRLKRDHVAAQRAHHRIRGDFRDEGIEPGQRARRGNRHLLVIDQRLGRAEQLGIAAGGFALGGVGMRVADYRDLLGHFLGGKAIGQCAAVFERGLDHPAAPLAVHRVDRQLGAAAFLEDVAGAETGGAERGVLFAGAAQQAAVDDAIADLPQQVFLALGQGVGLVQPVPLAADRDPFGQRRIDIDIVQLPGIGADRAGLGLRLGRGRLPVAEALADRLLDEIGIEIADHIERGMRRHIFARPERLESLGCGPGQRIRRADRQPAGDPRSGQQELDLVLIALQREGVAIAHFGLDHAALTLDRAGIEGQLARRLAHQHQGDAEQFRIVARQVEHVGGPLVPGRGVGIGPEGQPVALEQLDHLAFGHIGRSVEGHVLDIVGKAALVVVLVERARIDLHPHQRRALGRGVLADHIAHPVGQLAEPVTGIDRDIALLEGPVGLRRGGAGQALGLRGAGGQGKDGNGKGEQQLAVLHRR